jgi:hypothetical protein
MVEEEEVDPLPEWIQYKYRIAHPVLRFLPSKLAEFIGEKLCRKSRNSTQAR